MVFTLGIMISILEELRVGKNEAIYGYLLRNHPELVEDEYFRPHDTAVISIPQKAPDGATMRTESAFQLLERVKYISELCESWTSWWYEYSQCISYNIG